MNRRLIGTVCVGMALLVPGALLFAQDAPPPPPSGVGQPSEPQLLTPDQLDNLVAPIALYPDPLLSQVLAASTYPLEVVEAQQWLQQNQNLHGQQLMDAAREQNWDPSVQALVAFPDVLTNLNRDVQWTTDLGNAFLAQQKDLMAAVQRMRRRAQQNGKLTSNAQETVTTESQDGENAVVIQPANPQVIYVPVYNPAYVWGPPVWGYYPPLWYPGIGFGFGWGPGIYLGAFFPGWGIGWGGWGLGWGWGCGWFGGGIFVNNFFFNHYGFYHGYFGGRFPAGGRAAWAHDSFHRAGVPYANRGVAARFNNSRYSAGRYNAGGGFNGARATQASRGGWQRFNNGGSSNRGGSNSFARGAAGNRGYSNAGGGRSYAAPNGGRNFSSPNNGSRSYAAPNAGRSFSRPNNGSRSYAAPNAGRSFSSPNSGSRGFSSPRSSGGGFSGGHSGGFGGGHSGGFGGGHSGGFGGGHSGGFGGGHAGGGGHGGGGHGGRR